MTHLTDVELVDLARRRARAAAGSVTSTTCDTLPRDGGRACARRSRARPTSEMPEPSPLFWEHFSARVHEGVRAEPVDEPSGWFGWAHGARP